VRSTDDVERMPWRRRASVLRRALRGADRRASALLVTVLVIDAVSATAQVVALKVMVDAAADHRPVTALLGAAVAALAIGAFAVSGRVLADMEMLLANQSGLDVNTETLRLVSGTPGIEHLERPAYLDRVALVRAQRNELFRAVFSFAQLAALATRLLIGVALLATVHPLLVAIPLFAVPSAVLVPRANRHVAAADADAAERQRAATHLHGLFLAREPAMEMRVFGCVDALDERADELWSQVGGIAFRGALRAAVLGAIGWAVLALGYVGALLLVTVEASRGRATAGDLVLVAQLSLHLRSNVSDATDVARRAVSALTTIDRFCWLEDTSREQGRRFRGEQPAPDRIIRGIALEGVSFTYPGADGRALCDVSLSIPAGSTVAVVGPNGAGKTTLVNLLTRLYLPTEGRLLVDGVDLRTIDADGWADLSSAGFQDFLRLEATVRDAVGCGDLPRRDDDDAVLAALGAAEASRMVATWPEGLDTPLGRTYREGRELSVGQWQRLAIARAMMRQTPLLLVLDEPTASLDPEAEHALYERYASAAGAAAGRGGITVLVSHRFSSARLADLIVVLDLGVVVERGTHAELLAADGLYAGMFREQAQAYT